MLRHALRLLLVLALGLAPAIGSAEVYRWVDELGVTHYTTDRDTIPRRHRESANEIIAAPTRRPTRRARPATQGTTAPQPSEPTIASPALAPAARTTPTEPSPPPILPGPPALRSIPSDDPRATEVAELEAQIATDRESLRQMISVRRWDSAELASDPGVREIAERLPRLQAELEALRAETVP